MANTYYWTMEIVSAHNAIRYVSSTDSRFITFIFSNVNTIHVVERSADTFISGVYAIH